MDRLSRPQYPLIANVAFEAFSCYRFHDQEVSEQALSVLIADVSVSCDSDTYSSHVVPLAWTAIFIYCFGFLALSAMLLCCARTAILSGHPTRLSTSIRFLYKEYEPWVFWWELIEMARRLTLVGIFVLFERGSVTQLILATGFCASYLMIQTACNPFHDMSEDYLANGCSFALLVVFLCCIVLKLGTLTEQADVQAVIAQEQQRNFRIPSAALSLVLFVSVVVAIVVSSVVLCVQLAKERARVRREAASNKLPTCKWKLADGQQYVAFLSHYKVEAGAQVGSLSLLPASRHPHAPSCTQ
jgi:hypothetical protein